MDEFLEAWGGRYPAITRLWRQNWAEFVPFPGYDAEIRRVICPANAIESLNARYRRAVRARGHFPTELATLKCLYLVTRSLDPTGRGRARWVTEARPQRLRDHLRRPHHPEHHQLEESRPWPGSTPRLPPGRPRGRTSEWP